MVKPDLENFPKLPGCYIFKDKRHYIIYVGKSKSLYNRVRQYFNIPETAEHSKYLEMVNEACYVETIVTETETDALLLECRLIKEHKPKYNAQLKGTNPFPGIRIDKTQAYPAITITENTQDDGCEYFMCFYDRDDALRAIETLNGVWNTPTCRKASFSEAEKPCLNFYIGKCCAPCNGLIDRVVYQQKITEIIGCLNGDARQVISRLKGEMEKASASHEYEKAAQTRDNISALKRLIKRRKHLYADLGNQDVYLFFRARNEQRYSLFYICNGITISRIDFKDLIEFGGGRLDAFIADNEKGVSNIEDGEVMTSCLLDVYASKYFVPIDKNTIASQTSKKLRSAHREFISHGF